LELVLALLRGGEYAVCRHQQLASKIQEMHRRFKMQHLTLAVNRVASWRNGRTRGVIAGIISLCKNTL
jgi:hypothetical protein